jgi:hypothetical protein
VRRAPREAGVPWFFGNLSVDHASRSESGRLTARARQVSVRQTANDRAARWFSATPIKAKWLTAANFYTAVFQFLTADYLESDSYATLICHLTATYVTHNRMANAVSLEENTIQVLLSVIRRRFF